MRIALLSCVIYMAKLEADRKRNVPAHSEAELTSSSP